MLIEDYEIGDIVSGKDISRQSGRYIYACCPYCEYTRWIAYRKSAPNQKNSLCTACRIKEQKMSWKVGRASVR